MDSTVDGGTTEKTHVNIGQRNVFLHIRRCLDMSPEQLDQLTKDAEDG